MKTAPDTPALFLAAALLGPTLAAPVGAVPVATLVGHLPTGPQPTTVTILEEGRQVAVTCRGDESVWIFDAETLEPVERHSLVGYHGAWATATPTAGRLLVSNWKGQTLSVIDRVSGRVEGTIPVGIKPSYLALSPDGRRAYVAGKLSGDVALVDLERREPSRILETGQKPMGVVASPDGRWLFVAASKSNKISKVDLKHEVVLDNFGLALAETTNLAMTPDGRIVLAAGDHDRLLVVDAETGRTDKVKVGRSPAAVAVSPDGRWVFVAHYLGASVGIVDLATRNLIDELPVGPGCIHVATDGHRLYSVSDRAGALTVFDLAAVDPVELPDMLPEPTAPTDQPQLASPLAKEDEPG